MRRLLFLPFIALAFLTIVPQNEIQAQTVDLFCDDFDSLGVDSFYMTEFKIPSNAIVGFSKDSVVTKNNSPFSATDTVGDPTASNQRTTSYLVSPKVGVAGFDNVGVSFDQICYIDWFDEAIVEYSFDGGPWTRTPKDILNAGSLERVYTGNSLYQMPQRAFSKLSNPQIWQFLDSMFIFTRNTTAWVKESFNMTPVINRATRLNGGVPPDSMQIRLGLYDNPASPVGRSGIHQWWVDNFCIRGSNCELTPPNIVLDDPPANYPSRYEDRVYWVGPYIFNAQITDASQINRSYVEYYIKRDTSTGTVAQPLSLVFRDTVDLNFLGFSRYEGQIPKYFTNAFTNQLDSVLPGDSIYWKLEAIDNSPCFNSRQDPPAGFTSFQVRSNLPKACATQPIFNFPHYQTFNGPDFLAGPSGVLAEAWVNAEGDFHDWWVQTGPAADYPNTGPSDDHPGGSGALSKYLLLEATGFRDSTAYLLSPCIDLFEYPNNLIRFYLNQNGVGGDTVHFDLFDPTPVANFPDGKFINDIIPAIGGNKGDNWLPYEFSTYQYRNKVVQLRWRGTPSSASENTDIGLDSFKIVPAPIHDLRMDRVELGQFIPSDILDTVQVRVQNLGALPSTTYNVSYQVILNGNVVQTEGPMLQTGVIQPGDNVPLRLAIPHLTQLGEYTIKAWLDYGPDQTASNDTTLANTTGLFYKLIDCSREEFDDTNYWVGLANDSATFSNKWELGTPNFGRTNTAYTVPNSWDVLLNRGYAGSGGVEQLVTQFYNTEGADSVILSFMNNRAMENTQDGVFIEFSLDRGNTWTYLDNVNDTGRKRWYNSFLSAGGFGGQFVFSDTTRNMVRNWNNWVESEIMLPDVLEDKKEILFRFMFFAEDEPGGSAGMSVDNFVLYDQKGLDMESHRIIRPVSKCDLPSAQPFEAVFKNRGNAPVSSFDVTYIVKGPGAQVQTATETFNQRTVMPRDTVRFVSTPKFDFSLLGYYEVSIVTTLTGDICSANDTLSTTVENIDGCSFIFEAITTNYQDPKTIIDSSFWRFDITNGNDKYVITDDFVDFVPIDTNRQEICIKSGSQVRFQLGDVDNAIAIYSFIAFDGQNDTVFVDQENGGPDAKVQFFDWNCPPERSAKLLDLIVKTENNLPIEGNYRFNVRYQNNGLDSIDFVEVGLQIDNEIVRINDTINPPNPKGLKYTRKRTIGFPVKYLTPGQHEFTAWVHDPNGLPDQLPTDDTLRRTFTVIDTSVYEPKFALDSNGNSIEVGLKYCTTFEDSAKVKWIAYNPYPDTANAARSQAGETFVRSTPATQNMSGAYSGTKAWVTNDTGNYKNVDSAALLSPFFRMSLDSCYKVSFYNNYVIRDRFNDGGQFQISGDFGESWRTIFYTERDSANYADSIKAVNGLWQKNWHNARHIKAIPDNTNNSGWTGESQGWIFSENIFGGVQPLSNPANNGNPGLNPFGQTISNRDTTFSQINLIGNTHEYLGVFRFRFESDATITDEGWAIDDFCIETIHQGNCFAVGLEEQLARQAKDQVYIGQNIPNPANQSTSIPYYLPKSANMTLKVINVMGQELYVEPISKQKGSGYIDLDLSSYSQGIYYYTIDIDGRAYTHKMIVTK